MNERALGLLGIARKGGFVQIGDDPVSEAVAEGHARLILVAGDAGEHTVRRSANLAAVHSTPVVSLENDKASLGAVFGRASVALIAVTDINLALHILQNMDDPDRYAQQTASVREKAALMKQRKQAKPRKRKNHVKD